jgi:hypothetical protein
VPGTKSTKDPRAGGERKDAVSCKPARPGFILTSSRADRAGPVRAYTTTADAAPGRPELRSLPNNARKRAFEALPDIKTAATFPVLEFHGGNGGEFTGKATDIRCKKKTSRSPVTAGKMAAVSRTERASSARNYAVRGYRRYDTRVETEALHRVWRLLCPPADFFIRSGVCSPAPWDGYNW